MSTQRCRVDDGKTRGERDRESSFPLFFFFEDFLNYPIRNVS